jgi:hypothetical protein
LAVIVFGMSEGMIGIVLEATPSAPNVRAIQRAGDSDGGFSVAQTQQYHGFALLILERKV